MTEIVYILTNETMPGLIKIGLTTGDAGGILKSEDIVVQRMKALYTTGVALPFECFYAAEVSDATAVEKAIHTAFGDHRISPNREFFKLSPDKPKAILRLLELRNATPKVSGVGEQGDQEALDDYKTKKASPFAFHLIPSLKVGDELQSVFDETITCTIADDKKVMFRGQLESLSSAALKIAHEKGYAWTKIGGPDYWKHGGMTLNELREKAQQGLDGEEE